MARVRGDTIINRDNLASTVYYDVELDGYPRMAVQAVYTDATPSPVTLPDTDVDIVNDRFLYVNHGLSTGLAVNVSTSGTLPSPLVAGTDYFVIKMSADYFKLALTLADAEAGNVILINSAGSGNHTFTPKALNANKLKGQASNDGLSYVDVPSLIADISSAGTAIFNIVEPAYRYLRVIYVPSAGSINLSVVLNAHDILEGTFALSA
jgi:hypothetical protein